MSSHHPPSKSTNRTNRMKKGTSTELMPSIMGAFDTLIETNRSSKPINNNKKLFDSPKRTHQSNNFANLSPGVMKILSNVTSSLSDEEQKDCDEISYKLQTINRFNHQQKLHHSLMKSAERNSLHNINKIGHNDIISAGVQKMISNLPDAELVLAATTSSSLERTTVRSTTNSDSILHPSISPPPPPSEYFLSKYGSDENSGNKTIYNNNNNNNNNNSSFVGGNSKKCVVGDNNLNNSSVTKESTTTINNDNSFSSDIIKNSSDYNNASSVPLGSYLHTTQGIASRTPVGRKNMGKYLQVPSESTNSTLSSEVSRPVSLTSLGSCSSSGSSGPHQPSSAYLASAESLDSDPEPTGSQGSADSGIAVIGEGEELNMSPENRVLKEVLDTETVYVEHLGEVIQGYLEPWKSEPDCPLREHLPSLFSNLEEIYKFNHQFLQQLLQVDFNPSKIANVFIQNNADFIVYNEYCTNYPRTMQVLAELTAKDNMAGLFREKQMLLGHALPLGAYLLKPVQRILKYHLLLQRLSKQCEDAHKPAVDLALTTMTSVASNINNMKLKHENKVRVHEIQSKLYGWTGSDLTTMGELIAEGTFRVSGAKGRRYVCLFDKVLIIAKNKQDGVLAYKSHIMCSILMLVEQVRGEPLSFQILPFDNPRLQCTLRARSPQHKREWTLQLKRVILENYSAVIPNHARQLVMQLGQDVQETGEDNDKWSPLNKISSSSSTTPHYLERRSRVRKSRDLNRRASSQDRTFTSLSSWRRKSEPSMEMIPQYNSKTMPKKISKLKKCKNTIGTTKFYTDLSDSENCDGIIGESTESINQSPATTTTMKSNSKDSDNNKMPHHECERTIEEVLTDDEVDDEIIIEKKHVENNIEKIVSELLMQQAEYQKVINWPRRRSHKEQPWYDDDNNRAKVATAKKADSLPRSFQLNDQIDDGNSKNETKDVVNDKKIALNSNLITVQKKQRVLDDESLKESVDPDDEQHENSDLASQLDDSDCPAHKIYRKSAIRFSLVQRIRALVREDVKNSPKFPLRKQGSKSMGEKIAHPDYADPQKLFASSALSSCSNLNVELSSSECEILMTEPEHLDMTISENEVLNEVAKRLEINSSDSRNNLLAEPNDDSFENCCCSASSSHDTSHNSSSILLGESSQNSDSYYECMLEENLVEEYTKDASGKLVAKQDSFKNAENTFYLHKYNNKSSEEKKALKEINGIEKNGKIALKRPTKAPPPIPTKPPRLTAKNVAVMKKIESENVEIKQNCEKSWVKAMVGRFE